MTIEHPAGAKLGNASLPRGGLRAVIVRVGAFGDILHALPAVCALRQQLPDAYLSWVVDPRWLPLLASTSLDPVPGSPSMPIVDHCFLANTKLWKRRGVSAATITNIAQLTREMRAQNLSLSIDLQGSLRSAVLGKLSGAFRLVGSATPRERPASLLYTERIRAGAQHVVAQGCELLAQVFGIPLSAGPVQLPLDPDAEQWAEARLPSHTRPILLAPTAGWGAKEWPPERFASVARELSKAGHLVLVNATSPTDDTASRVVAASDRCAEPIACSLSQLIAIVRRSRLVIAGDTGPLHLAAALDVPVVGLYGPTDPARTGPWRTRARVLRDPASVTDHRRHRATEAGLLNIHVNHVLDAAWELLF